MYSSISTASLHGIMSMIIKVEADVSNGMPVFEMVGILSSEVKEAKERIKAAIRNAGYALPPKKVTVNLCPADVRKSGTGFDLPIALAVLAAYGIVTPIDIEKVLFIGEIALSGEIRKITGILPMVLAAKEAGYETVVVPEENAKEASFVKGIKIIPVLTLTEVIHFVQTGEYYKTCPNNIEASPLNPEVDFARINGQYILKRACEVAACGMHNILMVGPPGAGKTMAAKAIPGILPPLSEEEMLKLTGLYSVKGLFEERRDQLYTRPFRSPHYSVTRTALIGGGRIPSPGEITLANEGVLFLDEFTEYRKEVLEQLRQPLEERKIRLVRNAGVFEYPADFMLVAAMNPCNCGYYPDMEKCVCTSANIQRHLQKISRPLLDRIDISVEVPRIPVEELTLMKKNETSAQILSRIIKAQEIQKERYVNERFRFNSRIPSELLQQYCPMQPEAYRQMISAYERLHLSARSYHKLIRVARSIADLDGKEVIEEEHIIEALMYRSMDDALWRGIV